MLNLKNGKEDIAVKQLVKIMMMNEAHKTHVFEEVECVLLREAQTLCMKSSPSVLRGVSKDALQELKIEKLSSELEVSITKLLETIFMKQVIQCW